MDSFTYAPEDQPKWIEGEKDNNRKGRRGTGCSCHFYINQWHKPQQMIIIMQAYTQVQSFVNFSFSASIWGD